MVYTSDNQGPGCPWVSPCAYPHIMNDSDDNVRGVIHPSFGIRTPEFHETGGNHQYLLYWPSLYHILSQSWQKFHPWFSEHVVRADEVLIGGKFDIHEVVSLPCVVASEHQLVIHCWYEFKKIRFLVLI